MLELEKCMVVLKINTYTSIVQCTYTEGNNFQKLERMVIWISMSSSSSSSASGPLPIWLSSTNNGWNH